MGIDGGAFMKQSNTILFIFVGIIIFAAVLYAVAFLLKRRNEDRLDKLETRKIALFDLPVIEEVDEVKRMHLVGQSQNTFREWNQKWAELSTGSFADLESRIFEVESLNETFRFLKVKNAIQEAYDKMDEMEIEVENIRGGLKELRESEERNSLAVQEALDAYEEVSLTVKNEASSFGPALKELQKQIQNVETEFTQFVALNTAGDPMEARTVLEQAEEKTYAIQEITKKLPPLFEELSKVFPEQIKEVEEGYDKLVKDHFNFEDDTIKTDIQKVNNRLTATLSDLEKCEVSAVESSNVEIAAAIDRLYDAMEKEIQAREYVMENQKNIAEYITHAYKNNRQLMIELDHTSQSYALNHNELGQARGFQAHIEELQRANQAIEEKLKAKAAVFSQIEASIKEIYAVLDDIENQQVEIDSSLQELRKGEKIAQKKVDDFEFKLRTLKRYVEKQRLPGIPADYLEFFFVATDRVEELAKELNKIRIDVEQINKLVDLCEEDLELLELKTNELVDSAALTEQMLQYANRFRHTHGNVKQSIDRTLELFGREYRYQDALDEIGTALEQTEPGAFKRIESFYYNSREII